MKYVKLKAFPGTLSIMQGKAQTNGVKEELDQSVGDFYYRFQPKSFKRQNVSPKIQKHKGHATNDFLKQPTSWDPLETKISFTVTSRLNVCKT